MPPKDTNVETKGFRSTWLGYATAFVYLLIVQAIGIFLFTSGFLLSRPVLDQVAESSADIPAAFDKAVIVVIDALRFDFTMPGEHDDLHFHDKLPILHDYFVQQPDNTILLKFIADPPTTTLQRLKGLTTGSLPTFVDAGSNFAGTEVEEDSWMLQLDRLNKTIAFMGDDTWTALFNSKIDPQMNFPYPSLNVWDLHSVDNGVIEHLLPLLNSDQHFSVAIGHLLGVDHAGHRYGPNHPAMAQKLQQMNGFLQDVIDSIDDDTLLIVMGDHGMDPRGDHGGDSLLELESTLWMHTKKTGQFNRNGPVLESSTSYDTSARGKYFRSVAQIDLVPTLSLLLGLPIPYNNLGFPIPEAFPPKQWDAVGRATVDQIEEYRQNIINSGEESYIADSLYSAVSSISSAREYQKFILGKFHERWVEFDLKKMYTGLAFVVFSLAISVAIYANAWLAAAGVRFDAPSMARFATITGILGVSSISLVNKALWMEGLAVGLLIGFLITGINSFGHVILSGTRGPSSKQWAIFFFITITHCLLFGSNSFTVWEDDITNFLLVTFAFLGLLRAIGGQQKVRFAIWHSAVIVLLVSLTSYSRVCREEQSSPKHLCKSTFYVEGSSISSPYSLATLAISALALPQFIKAFYMMTSSYTGSAPMYIGVGLQVIMGLSVVYWGLDAADSMNLLVDYVSTIRQFKLLVARTALGASLVAWIYSWNRGNPLCIELDVEKSKTSESNTQASILGYGNIYGSNYFLMILGVFGSLLVVNKPMGGVVLVGLVYLVLSALELVGQVESSKRNSDIVTVAVLCLTGMAFFFKTGHQVTVPAIQWDIGFVPAEDIIFPFTHIVIVLNTFGSIIITVLAVPLLVLWRIQPSRSPRRVISRIARKLALVNIYYTLLAVASMAMAAHLRRHLMVWKVFAPRFMFAAISLLVVDVVVIIALLASGKTVRYISSIFA